MSPARGRILGLGLLGLGLGAGMLAMASGAGAQTAGGGEAQVRLSQLRNSFQSRHGGVLALMGYNMTPDGSTNSLQISRGSGKAGGDGATSLQLSQFGFGFTVSESLPIFLESYIGFARYDPRAYITEGAEGRRLPLRWNNFTATLGVGYDIRLGEYLWLRPILNGSIGTAASDASLFGAFVDYRRGTDLSALTDKHMNVYGIGASLMLAYYDYTPARNIDVELRYTQLRLQSFGNTPEGLGGSSTPRTLGLWARLRWPTGWEAFGRPVRWVIDGNATTYLGDQRQALGFSWGVKIGGGIEVDVGRYEVGAMGINLNRVRLIGRYFFGDGGVTGISLGIGMSF